MSVFTASSARPSCRSALLSPPSSPLLLPISEMQAAGSRVLRDVGRMLVCSCRAASVLCPHSLPPFITCPVPSCCDRAMSQTCRGVNLGPRTGVCHLKQNQCEGMPGRQCMPLGARRESCTQRRSQNGLHRASAKCVFLEKSSNDRIRRGLFEMPTQIGLYPGTNRAWKRTQSPFRVQVVKRGQLYASANLLGLTQVPHLRTAL